MKGRRPNEITAGTATLTDAPKPPAWLSKDAKAEWRRVAPILVERAVLTEADLGILESYVVAIARVREAERTIARDGATITVVALILVQMLATAAAITIERRNTAIRSSP
mgnify:CR=1 FL=1